jgi:hypothetical protein
VAEEAERAAWTDTELDAVVADYFSMLDSELAGEPYVKSRHRARLRKRIERSDPSIEFKHRNISAVLEAMGLPRIAGYLPAQNFQKAIFPAIDRYLSSHIDPVPALALAEERRRWLRESATFVEVPDLRSVQPRPEALENLVRKFDPAERDQRNRALGRAGEEFVISAERERLILAERSDLADKIRWIADEEGDGAGFDVLSYEPGGKERQIEVKTTNGAARTPFFISRNEMATAERKPDSWRLYRVHLFAQAPAIFSLQPPLDRVVHLRTETWRASF